ncbi:MAG: AsmA family protein [Gammaproteobacteria bacterium]|nr:AsmA family protein [Gammaproteobacteria bacterium]
MKKRLLLAFGVIAVVLVGALLALPELINVNAVKDRVVSALSAATGRHITIARMRLTVFPWLGVRIDGAAIANAPGFGTQPLATVDDAVVEVKLLPLLDKRLVIRRVVLTRLTLNLETRGPGVDNWQMGSTRPAPHPAPAPAEAKESPLFHLLQAAGVSVRDATVRYTDLRSHTHYGLAQLSLRTGTIEPAKPVQIAARGRLQTATLNVPFRLTARARMQGSHYSVSPLQFALGDLILNGDVEATRGPGGWVAHGSLRVPRFAPRPLFTLLHLAYRPASPKAWQSASAHLGFSYTSSGVLLTPLIVHVDNSTMTGHLSLDARSHLYRVQLDIDTIAPARYLPQTPPSPGPARPAVAPARLAPPSALTTLDVRGLLRVGRLDWHHVVLTHVTIPLVLHHGLAVLDPVDADLYGGTFAGRVAANEAAASPTVAVSGRLAQVQVGPLLTATGLSDSFSGVLQGQARLHAHGHTAMAIERSLSGNMNMAISHGSLRGLDLDFIASDPRVAAGSHRLKKVTGTAFQHLRASAVIVHGVAHTRDLYIKTSRAVVHGQGTIDLPGKSLDYLLQVSLPTGFTVPVNVKGPFGHVRFGIAVGRLLGERSTKKAVRHFGHALQNILGIH